MSDYTKNEVVVNNFKVNMFESIKDYKYAVENNLIGQNELYVIEEIFDHINNEIYKPLYVLGKAIPYGRSMPYCRYVFRDNIIKIKIDKDFYLSIINSTLNVPTTILGFNYTIELRCSEEELSVEIGNSTDANINAKIKQAVSTIYANCDEFNINKITVGLRINAEYVNYIYASLKSLNEIDAGFIKDAGNVCDMRIATKWLRFEYRYLNYEKRLCTVCYKPLPSSFFDDNKIFKMLYQKKGGLYGCSDVFYYKIINKKFFRGFKEQGVQTRERIKCKRPFRTKNLYRNLNKPLHIGRKHKHRYKSIYTAVIRHNMTYEKLNKIEPVT